MFQVGFRHLQHGRAKRGHAQPMGHLVAQHAGAGGDGAVIGGGFALAGDHQHKAQSSGLGV